MVSTSLFRNRAEAGEKLAEAVFSEVSQFRLSTGDAVQPIVYALPRGGLPIAVPIARLLHCPLDIVIAKKITRPDNPELAIGAVTAEGHVVWSPQKPRNVRLQKAALQQAQEKAIAQMNYFAPQRPQVSSAGRLAILVDDGVATGMTIIAAAQALRLEQPIAVWICVPVAPTEVMEVLEQESDLVIALETPHPFFSVSRFYDEFHQVDSAEALLCLQQQSEWQDVGEEEERDGTI